MNKASKQTDLVFAVVVGIILAGALWFTIGQWIIFSLCQSNPTKQCTDQATSITMILAIIFGAIIAGINIQKALKNKA